MIQYSYPWLDFLQFAFQVRFPLSSNNLSACTPHLHYSDTLLNQYHFPEKPWNICQNTIIYVSFGSISSTSSSDIAPKCPTLPVPDYSPGKTDSPEKPNQRYRRRTNGKGIDHKINNNRHSTKDIIYTNGHVKHEHHVQNPKDTGDYIEVH